MQEAEERKQFEDKELWQQFMSGRIVEEEVVEDRFRPNIREVKEKFQ